MSDDLFIAAIYKLANKIASQGDEAALPADLDVLPPQLRADIDTIVANAESCKGVMTVALTSVIYKALHHEQDVRRHQSSIPGGYSGRTFDAHHITPFLRDKQFPCMAESGWLTRSLEQKQPYTLTYPGAIKPKELKTAFLRLLHCLETQRPNAADVAKYFFVRLIRQRDSKRITLVRPANLPIGAIVRLLSDHFSHPYIGRGASRLPVIAFYAIYQCLLRECKRFQDMTLLPLANHNSADLQSGRLGDIDVVDQHNNPFEAVEVKHAVAIDREIMLRAKEKIMPTTVRRYYILSTAHVNEEQRAELEAMAAQVKSTHGCQIVVNGIVDSLKYYLRLLADPAQFIDAYVALLAADDGVKFDHKQAWNQLAAN